MATITLNSAKRANTRLFSLAAASIIATASTYAYYDSKSSKSPTPQWNKDNKTLFLSAAPLALFTASTKKDHSEGDYQKVYNSIAKKIEEYDSYDEGIGFGPVLVRLAWHQAGTYSKTEGADGCPYHVKNEDGSQGVGGSFGGTMRLPKEAGDPANNGLQNARWLLEDVKAKFPWISHGDLYTLSGVVAVQEMGGPKIGWRSGREDLPAEYQQNSKLPDASQGADYVRHLFGRMGLNDREVVSLIGAHALGSCHVVAPALPTDDDDDEEGESTGPGSGYTGRWTASPNMFTNEFFKLLLNDKWEWKEWDGPKQYVNKDDLMMLPADMALIEDPKYKKIVQTYANDQDLYFKDFSKDFQKLLELGIDFGQKKNFYFKTLDEQS
jgi:cytochrome c peroxidase